MGMYDSLKIDKSVLPISEELKATIKDGYEWQTKDIEQRMLLGEIRNDGKLYYPMTTDDELEFLKNYSETMFIDGKINGKEVTFLANFKDGVLTRITEMQK